MSKKEKKYRITVSESQLRMIAACVEDCSRFMSGQTELYNCTSMLDDMHEVHEALKEAYPYVVPDLRRKYGFGAYYPWNGGGCPNEYQRKFIAESYYLYREIKHFDAVSRGVDNVYSSATLRCEDSGMPIVIEEVRENDEMILSQESVQKLREQAIQLASGKIKPDVSISTPLEQLLKNVVSNHLESKENGLEGSRCLLFQPQQMVEVRCERHVKRCR